MVAIALWVTKPQNVTIEQPRSHARLAAKTWETPLFRIRIITRQTISYYMLAKSPISGFDTFCCQTTFLWEPTDLQTWRTLHSGCPQFDVKQHKNSKETKNNQKTWSYIRPCKPSALFHFTKPILQFVRTFRCYKMVCTNTRKLTSAHIAWTWLPAFRRRCPAITWRSWRSTPLECLTPRHLLWNEANTTLQALIFRGFALTPRHAKWNEPKPKTTCHDAISHVLAFSVRQSDAL